MYYEILCVCLVYWNNVYYFSFQRVQLTQLCYKIKKRCILVVEGERDVVGEKTLKRMTE